MLLSDMLTAHNFLYSRYIQPSTHRHQLRIDSSTVTTYGDCSKNTTLSYWQHSNAIHLYICSFHPNNRVCKLNCYACDYITEGKHNQFLYWS